MTIETVVTRVLSQTNRTAAPIRQRCLDALNELLQEAHPLGRDAQAEIHVLAADLDVIELAVYQELGIEPPEEIKPKPALDGLIEAAVQAKLAELGVNPDA